MIKKPIILTFIKHYLPGYKAGGPLRSISNTIDHLGHEFDFRIISSDRDQGDVKPYDDIKINHWQSLGSANVYYLAPQSCTLKGMISLITATEHDILYLNSFFDPHFSIKLLLARYMGWLPMKPVIIAPRGEFEEGSIKIKYPKKYTYIQVARCFRLYKNIYWHASTEYEALDIARAMKIKTGEIHIAFNLPARNIIDIGNDVSVQEAMDSETLKLVFLSRISREKNLDYALRVLKKITTKVRFDIYGPAEDAIYWKLCQELIGQLPKNVTVNYLGSINPSKVVQIFSRYDLFLFPTSGENYGHVIVESLTAGTPVLISDKTPWRNLEEFGFGWDKNLDQMDSFVSVIEELALISTLERKKYRDIIKIKFIERLIDHNVVDASRQLFRKCLLHQGD